jgi:hypothetical protein
VRRSGGRSHCCSRPPSWPLADFRSSTWLRTGSSPVDVVREATAGLNPPSFQPVDIDCHLSTLGSVTAADVTDVIRRLPDKQCSSSLLPTWVFKLCADVLAPFLAFLPDRSFVTGSIPASYKAAYTTA